MLCETFGVRRRRTDGWMLRKVRADLYFGRTMGNANVTLGGWLAG